MFLIVVEDGGCLIISLQLKVRGEWQILLDVGN